MKPKHSYSFYFGIGVLFFLCMISFRAGAQANITGSIFDKASNQPIEFASVVLRRLPDSLEVKGTATDKKGRYILDNVTPGRYLLQCSFIGFEKLFTSPFIIKEAQAKLEYPVIHLVNTGKLLQDVTVVGRRSLLNNSIDRKIYNVEQDIMSRSGTASDILKNIPSVEVDIDGNVSLRGSGDIVILINGKPSPLMGRTRADVLQQLPANSIERIEVITNPSARYRPDGSSGIINIVLKKNIRNGFNGSSTVNAGLHDRYNGAVVLNYKPGKLNLMGSYSLRQDYRGHLGTNDRTYRDSATGKELSYYKQDNTSYSRPFAHILTGGVDYNLDSRNSIGASATYFYRNVVNSDITTTLRYNNAEQLTSHTLRMQDGPEHENEVNGTAYYQHNFPKEDHELRIEFNSSNEDEVEDNHYSNHYLYPVQPSNFDNFRVAQGNHENQLTIDYTNPLTDDSKMEAGYDGLYNKLDLDYMAENYDATVSRFVKDLKKSNRFIYNENIHAAYVTYQRGFEKFGYSVGLRSEATMGKSKLTRKDSSINNEYFKLYPTVHLSYKLTDKAELQLNYSKRVHRPEADHLNPFPEYQDSLNLHSGNPKLKPEMVHSIEFGYKWQGKNISFIPSLYYRVKEDGFTWVVIPLNDSVLLSTIQNLASDQSAGLELIFSGRPVKWMNANWSTNFFYNTIDASNLGYIKNKAIISMSSNLSTTFSLSRATMMQVSANYRSPRLTAQGKSFGSFVMNAGVRQDFLKNKISVTLTGSDLFNSMRHRNVMEIPSLIQESLHKRAGRIIFLGVSYRFGIIKQKEDKLQFDEEL